MSEMESKKAGSVLDNRDHKGRRIHELLLLVKEDAKRMKRATDLTSNPKMSNFICKELFKNGKSRAKQGTAFTLKDGTDLFWEPGDKQLSIKKKNQEETYTSDNTEICAFTENPIVSTAGAMDENSAKIVKYCVENADLLWQKGFRIPGLHDLVVEKDRMEHLFSVIDQCIRDTPIAAEWLKNRYMDDGVTLYKYPTVRSVTRFYNEMFPYVYSCDGTKRWKCPPQGPWRFAVYIGLDHRNDGFWLSDANLNATVDCCSGKCCEENWKAAPWLRFPTRYPIPADMGEWEEVQPNPNIRCALHGIPCGLDPPYQEHWKGLPLYEPDDEGKVWNESLQASV